MKKFLLKTALVTMMFLTFSGCSSDSDSSCTPIPCLNGGVSNSDCGCDCPQGYTGDNCSLEITPTKIKINKIRIKKFTDSGWDTFNGPDIYIKLYKSNILIFTSSTYAPNAVGDGSLYYDEVFNPTFESNSTSIIFKMELLDYDGNDTPANTDDLMTTLYFSPFVGTEGLGFPSSFNIQDSSGQYRAEVFVTYEW